MAAIPGPSAAGDEGQIDAHDLGPALEPAIVEASAGTLSDIRWFRTDWQLGGAATAYAKYRPEQGAPSRDAVIKLPVGYREYRFLTGLAQDDAPTPRIALHGQEIGGYDFAWVVMERLPGLPLSGHLHKEVFEHLARAAAGFYRCAGERWAIESPPAAPDWAGTLERAREAIRDNPQMPSAQRWGQAVKDTQRHLDRLVPQWNARPINTWCHGDLHPGNCMERTDGASWECKPGFVLFDLAEVHCGHWVEDAVYLERLFWGRPQAIDGAKPVSLIAKARRDQGLDTSDDYAGLANLRRVLMAATTPAFLHHEGHPAYLEAALTTLERLLPQVTK